MLRVHKTAKTRGAVRPENSLAYRMLLALNLPTSSRILDFGAGPEAPHTRLLRDHGYGRTYPWELPENRREGLHLRSLVNISVPFDAVLLSRVLNVQESRAHQAAVLQACVGLMALDGVLVASYPEPRRAGLLTRENLEGYLRESMLNSVRSVGTVLVCREPRFSWGWFLNRGEETLRLAGLNIKEG